MTLANIVSFIRIGLVPVFLILFFSEIPSSRIFVAIVFVLTGITDAIDGYLARSRHEISRLGKLIDPLADKLVMAAAFISLGIVGRMPLWLSVVLVAKELALVVGAAVFLVSKDEVVASSVLGKSATVVLYVGVTMSILEVGGAIVVVGAGVAISVLAGLDYARRVFLQRR